MYTPYHAWNEQLVGRCCGAQGAELGAGLQGWGGVGGGREGLKGTDTQYMHTCAFSVLSDCATPWTAACQAPLSMGFPRQEHRMARHLLQCVVHA